MKRIGVTVRKTVILLNSDIIRKSPDLNEEADNRLKKIWIQNIASSFRIKPENISFTLGDGISYLHFREEVDLNKFLFIKFMEKRKGVGEEKRTNSKGVALISNVLPHLGDVDYMEEGNTT
jgi:hypothetical protein